MKDKITSINIVNFDSRFILICKKCSSTDNIVRFWAGSEGDSGYLEVICNKCDEVVEIEDDY